MKANPSVIMMMVFAYSWWPKLGKQKTRFVYRQRYFHVKRVSSKVIPWMNELEGKKNLPQDRDGGLVHPFLRPWFHSEGEIGKNCKPHPCFHLVGGMVLSGRLVSPALLIPHAFAEL